jgi:cell wall-associated NlpC family hydrolase
MASMLEAWAAERIGAPFVVKGRTRAGYDCAGLLLDAYREVYGIELPTFTNRYEDLRDRAAIAAVINEQRDQWRPVIAGQERPGDAILLRIFGLPIHVGLVIARGQFLHAIEGLGVCLEDYRLIQWRRRVLGFYRPVALEAAAWA